MVMEVLRLQNSRKKYIFIKTVIASSEIASILDTTNSPDSIVKMYYNIMNSFSIKSFHSIRVLGLSDYSSLQLARFRRYTDQISSQLILTSVLGNSVNLTRSINLLISTCPPKDYKKNNKTKKTEKNYPKKSEKI